MDRRVFYDRVRPLFGGHLRQEQVSGMDAILDNWDGRVRDGDLRWLAYMLATAFHETNQTMQPVREAYWLSESWRQRNLRYYPYYGRGYVQLTWPDNYRRAGQFVGADLMGRPDLAMEPGCAATVMFVGMQEGWFRGDAAGRQTLARHFNRNTDDPVGAREIINGREFKKIDGQRVLLATVIARYHNAFLQALMSARSAAPVAPLTRDVIPPLLDDLSPQTQNFFGGFNPPSELADTADFTTRDTGSSALDFEFDAGADQAAAVPSDDDAMIERTIRIVTAYLGNNQLDAAALPELISGVHYALTGLSRAPCMPPPQPPDALATPAPTETVTIVGGERPPRRKTPAAARQADPEL